MTLAPEAPHALEAVAVRFSPDGTPLAVRHDGQIWVVDPDVDTAHWFTRDSWWDTQRSTPPGVGNVVDIEYWRVQVRLGPSTSALRTFELRRDPLAQQWLLESITDNRGQP
ncbi:hypothetical protein [Arthrobacter sp. ISL-28]|uniref:hypothetical protein n=1 Tax=Arthrobacter sp. ISL-28 TaxID=2819108 RepID=UPI001BE806F8|nr:hypothetical protein [Arthrobacter sp. ISL-28]MBT2523417.1 hypothetical protein [Arthrobacter sp. ISL-28]